MRETKWVAAAGHPVSVTKVHPDDTHWPRHWTKAPHSMVGVLRVGGHAYRFLGGKSLPETTATQTSVSVHPTRSVYTFAAGEVELRVTFTSPLLLDNLDLLSRPVTYVSLDVRGLDGRSHDVALYFDVSGEWTVDKPYHEVTWERLVHPDLHIGALRSFEQKPLARRGDDVRIDWGTLLLGCPPPTRRWPSGAPMPYDSSSLTMAACLRRTGKRPRTPRIVGEGPLSLSHFRSRALARKSDPGICSSDMMTRSPSSTFIVLCVPGGDVMLLPLQ